MRAIVAFGSRYGSTKATAEAIAETLSSKGVMADVIDLREGSRSVDGYDLAIIGSSIIAGSWSKASKRFLSDNAASLAGIRLAMFACCSQCYLRPEEREQQEKDFILDVAGSYGLTPEATGLFGGEIDFSKYNFIVRAVLKKVGVDKEFESAGADISRPYDFRDWDGIRGWASELVR